MPTNIWINSSTHPLSISTSVSPSLSSSYWGSAGSPPFNTQYQMLWFNRNTGITNGSTWTFTSTWSLGSMFFTFTVSLTGTFASSNFSCQLTVSCCGTTVSTPSITSQSSNFLNVTAPMVNGGSLSYSIDVNRWYTGGYDDVTIYIQPTTQTYDSTLAISNVSSGVSTADAYWTEERKRKAVPLQPAPYRGSQPPHTPSAVAPIYTPPTYTPAPYTTAPYNAVCKMFMTFGTEDFVGSAVLVGPNLLLTAAHNIYEPSTCTFATNVYCEFEFNNNVYLSPAVVPTSSYLVTDFMWNDNYAHDVAFLTVGTVPSNITPVPLQFFLQPTTATQWTSVGYPAQPNPPYNGQVMCMAKGNYVSGTDQMIMGSNTMGAGCSGGPWFMTSGSNTVITGMNSQKDSLYPTQELSPRLWIGAYSAWYLAANGLTPPNPAS